MNSMSESEQVKQLSTSRKRAIIKLLEKQIKMKDLFVIGDRFRY